MADFRSSDFATSAAPASSENDERCSLSVTPEGVLLAIADQKSRIENQPARVAKLADAPDLGSGGEILRGSSPLPGISDWQSKSPRSTLDAPASNIQSRQPWLNIER